MKWGIWLSIDVESWSCVLVSCVVNKLLEILSFLLICSSCGIMNLNRFELLSSCSSADGFWWWPCLLAHVLLHLSWWTKANQRLPESCSALFRSDQSRLLTAYIIDLEPSRFGSVHHFPSGKITLKRYQPPHSMWGNWSTFPFSSLDRRPALAGVCWCASNS